MFKKSYLMSVLLIAMLILGACGTSTQKSGSTSNKSNGQDTTEDVEQNEEENSDDEDELEEDEEVIEDETDNQGTEEDNDNQGTEEDDESEENGTNSEDDQNEAETDQFQENAKQVDSDAQDYAIHILPAYTLTSEEPGRDSLYLTEDGNTFMRIETNPFNQDDYDYFKENTVSLLESTKADGETVSEITEENSLPQGENVKNAVGYTVKANDSILTGIVFEKDGLLVRLTIFDTPTQEHYSNFLKMGETITNK